LTVIDQLVMYVVITASCAQYEKDTATPHSASGFYYLSAAK